MQKSNRLLIWEKCTQIWSQARLFIAFSVVVSLLIATAAELVIFHITGYSSILRFFAISILCGGAINLCRFHKFFRQNLDKAFLLICFTAGLPFIFLFPQVVHVSPDDHIHLRNAFVFLHEEAHWSDGLKILDSAIDSNTTGMSLREIDSLHQKINTAHEQTKHETTSFVESRNAYSRLVYLPYHIGFEISQFLDLKLTDMLIVAKTCNYVCYVLLIYYAIKISTRAKKIFFAVGLITANIFYATQFSYDPMVLSSIMLALALLFRMFEQDKINPKYILAFILLIVWGSLPKAIYCLLLLLLFLLPNKKFNNNKQAIACKGLTVILTILILATFILPIVTGGMGGDIRGGDTSVSGQINYILSNPIQFIKTLVKFLTAVLPGTILGQAGFMNFSVSNSIFDGEIVYILQFCYFTELILVLWAAFTTVWPKQILPLSRKMLLALLYSIIALEIVAAMYLSFNPVGHTGTIGGVQNRYFMPILPILLLIISPTGRRGIDTAKDKIIPVLCWYGCLALPILLFLAKTSFV